MKGWERGGGGCQEVRVRRGGAQKKKKWKRHLPGVRVAVVNVCGTEKQQDRRFSPVSRFRQDKRSEKWNYGMEKTA